MRLGHKCRTYMAVSNDDFELPLYIGDLEGVCRVTGVSQGNVFKNASGKTKTIKTSKFGRVRIVRIDEVYDDDDNYEWKD